MAVLQILKMGHPILRNKASKVTNFDKISELILNMKDTLKNMSEKNVVNSLNP